MSIRPIAGIRPSGHFDQVATLQAGDRIRLSGGYDFDPSWLSGRASVAGLVTDFIPGQNKSPAAVIALDEPITVESVTGHILVLELRYVGAAWETTGTVHVELCDFAPEAKRWQDRRQGKWIESNATYERTT